MRMLEMGTLWPEKITGSRFGNYGAVDFMMKNFICHVVFWPLCSYVWDVVADGAEDVVWDEVYSE
jgi:hypothetical protein